MPHHSKEVIRCREPASGPIDSQVPECQCVSTPGPALTQSGDGLAKYSHLQPSCRPPHTKYRRAACKLHGERARANGLFVGNRRPRHRLSPPIDGTTRAGRYFAFAAISVSSGIAHLCCRCSCPGCSVRSANCEDALRLAAVEARYFFTRSLD